MDDLECRIQEYYLEAIMAHREAEIKFEQGRECGMKERMEECWKRGFEEGFKEGFKKGFEEWFEIGRKEEALRIAQELLSEGLSEELILRVTGITPQELSDLKTDRQ